MTVAATTRDRPSDRKSAVSAVGWGGCCAELGDTEL